MENLGLIETKISVFIITNEDGTFTAFLANEKGGPIITASDKDKVKEEMEEAVSLMCAMNNLQIYKEAYDVAEKDESKDIANKMTLPPNIEYIEPIAA